MVTKAAPSHLVLDPMSVRRPSSVGSFVFIKGHFPSFSDSGEYLVGWRFRREPSILLVTCRADFVFVHTCVMTDSLASVFRSRDGARAAIEREWGNRAIV
mmetsp:Transcript_29498/g.59054  ORF Transcript_29498/g.59054 Transcript_29498/m.59054 type:complete len:100 (-) Transcript_29498:128-427(-)